MEAKSSKDIAKLRKEMKRIEQILENLSKRVDALKDLLEMKQGENDNEQRKNED